MPQYKVKKNQISVNKFIKKYKNYKIIGNLTTNDLNLDTIMIITTLLSELNIINILITIVLLYIIRKKTNKVVILSVSEYIILYSIINISLLLKCYILIFTVICIYILLKILKKENLTNYYYIVLLSLFANIIKYISFKKYINIYHEILDLNKLTTIEYIYQQSSYYILVVIIIIFIFVICKKIRVLLKKVTQ